MKIIVVDDNRSFLEALTFYIEENLKHQVIGSFDSGIELLDSHLIPEADIILLDIEMPLINGFEVAQRILKKYGPTKIVAVTNFSERAYLKELLLAGFMGCVLKNKVFDELSLTLNIVLKKGYYFPKNHIVTHSN